MSFSPEQCDEAQRLLRNPILLKLFDNLRKRYVADWSQSDALDQVKREGNYFRLKALEDFMQDLESLSLNNKVHSFNKTLAKGREIV